VAGLCLIGTRETGAPLLHKRRLLRLPPHPDRGGASRVATRRKRTCAGLHHIPSHPSEVLSNSAVLQCRAGRSTLLP
jgi:hypothetical protein